MEKYIEFKKGIEKYKDFLNFNSLNQIEIHFSRVKQTTKTKYKLHMDIDFLEVIEKALSNESIDKFEKDLNDYLETKPFQIYFIGNNSKESFNSLAFNCNKKCGECLDFFICKNIKKGKNFFNIIFSNKFVFYKEEDLKKTEVLTSKIALLNCKLQYIIKNFKPGKYKKFTLETLEGVE